MGEIFTMVTGSLQEPRRECISPHTSHSQTFSLISCEIIIFPSNLYFFVVDSKEVPDKKKLEQTLWNPDGADRNDRIMSSDHEDGYALIIV